VISALLGPVRSTNKAAYQAHLWLNLAVSHWPDRRSSCWQSLTHRSASRGSSFPYFDFVVASFPTARGSSVCVPTSYTLHPSCRVCGSTTAGWVHGR